MICASGSFGMLSSFVFVSNNLFKLFSNVNKNRVSILCRKFTRPKNLKNSRGILWYMFFPINARKSVTVSPEFSTILSAGMVDVLIFYLYRYLTQELFSYISFFNLKLKNEIIHKINMNLQHQGLKNILKQEFKKRKVI